MPKDKQEIESRTLFIRFQMGHRQSAYANVYKGIRCKKQEEENICKKTWHWGRKG